MNHQNQLLQEERNKISFNLLPISLMIYENEEILKHNNDYFRISDETPDLWNSMNFHNWSRVDQFKWKVPQIAKMQELQNRLKSKTDEIDKYMGPILYNQETQFFALQFAMVIPSIRILGTDEQLKLWYDDLLYCKIVCAYAQTELGHGSDVQNLQTRAVYDEKTDEFILDTPTINSFKCICFYSKTLQGWPGDLGLSSNYALVFAQLIVMGVNNGVQPFMVPIRCMETHRALPGITVGDIGPKLGYSTKDNGFLRLEQVRIPRKNMLSRYIQVSKTGQIKKRGNPKVSYAAMMVMRKVIIYISSKSAAMALTTAIRYSLIREQFKNDQNTENKVLDYQSQQDKLFGLLAQCYATVLAGNEIKAIVEQNFIKVQDQSDFSLLPVAHALLAGGKAYITSFVTRCSEWCRLSCGGHGFAHYSGLPSQFMEGTPNQTLEGENQIMFLQLSRFLLKMLKYSQTSPERIHKHFDLFQEIGDLMEFKIQNDNNQLNDPEYLIKILKSCVIHSVVQIGQQFMQLKENGIGMKQAWDSNQGIYLVEAGQLYMDYFVMNMFQQSVSNLNDKSCQKALQNLVLLNGVQLVLDNTQILIENMMIQPNHIVTLRKLKESILPLIRKDALGLVEAFALPDGVLKSTIGCYDGKAYERTLDWVKNKNSINKNTVKKGLLELKKVKPML